MTEERFTFLNKQGEKLAAVLHAPAKKTKKGVILCHGFTGSKEHWRNEAKEFAEQGIAALRFDFTGTGESEGSFEKTGYEAEVADLQCALDEMEKRGYANLGVMGHSFGGGVVVIASSRDKRIKAVLATAPTVFPTGNILGRYAQEGMGVEMDQSFFNDVKKVDVIGAAKKRQCPLMIIAGSADTIVPPSQSTDLFEAASDPKELTLMGGANHDFKGHEEELLHTAVAWMKKHL